MGISLLGAVGGIAHHPLQSVMADGASPRSLAAGVGLGLVGVFTKPLSGAAELVALTGQGINKFFCFKKILTIKKLFRSSTRCWLESVTTTTHQTHTTSHLFSE